MPTAFARYRQRIRQTILLVSVSSVVGIGSFVLGQLDTEAGLAQIDNRFVMKPIAGSSDRVLTDLKSGCEYLYSTRGVTFLRGSCEEGPE